MTTRAGCAARSGDRAAACGRFRDRLLFRRRPCSVRCVIPAKAGIQGPNTATAALEYRVRGVAEKTVAVASSSHAQHQIFDGAGSRAAGGRSGSVAADVVLASSPVAGWVALASPG